MLYSFLNIGLVLAIFLSFTPKGQAATATGNLSVTATVTNTCTLSATTPVAFGSIDGTFTTLTSNTGTITVICTTGETYSIALGVGNNPTGTFTFRRMTDGSSHFINYTLYSDSGRTVLWGDGSHTATLGNAVSSLTGTGVSQVYTVYGQIPTAQTAVPAGSYSDSVVVTVTYL